jgi:hypothetical protein
MKNWFIYLLAIVVIFISIKQCEETETKIETVTEYVKVTDTITNVVIQEVPKMVYVERLKTVKGKDSIVYVDKPTETTIQANQYDTTLESNNATADLKITTTGELLDVQGVINYTQENTTTTITKTKSKSGLFLYGKVPISNFNSPEIGVLYQFKNSIIIGSGVQYNNLTKAPEVTATIGIKIF